MKTGARKIALMPSIAIANRPMGSSHGKEKLTASGAPSAPASTRIPSALPATIMAVAIRCACSRGKIQPGTPLRLISATAARKTAVRLVIEGTSCGSSPQPAPGTADRVSSRKEPREHFVERHRPDQQGDDDGHDVEHVVLDDPLLEPPQPH